MTKAFHLPKLVAHRGAGKTAPENTLVAFRNGFLNGFPMFECDVRLSKDKALFLLHDDDLARTTNAKGLASDRTWCELSLLDAGGWHSAAFTSEPLLRLDAFMHFLVANSLSLNIELKPSPGQEYETGAVCARYIEEFCKEHNILVILSSFSDVALQGALETAPAIPRALLFDKWQDTTFDVIKRLECQGVVGHYPLLTEELVKQFKDAELFIMTYTANEPDTIKHLFNIGVDSVITDNMQAIELFG